MPPTGHVLGTSCLPRVATTPKLAAPNRSRARHFVPARAPTTPKPVARRRARSCSLRCARACARPPARPGGGGCLRSTGWGEAEGARERASGLEPAPLWCCGMQTRRSSSFRPLCERTRPCYAPTNLTSVPTTRLSRSISAASAPAMFGLNVDSERISEVAAAHAAVLGLPPTGHVLGTSCLRACPPPPNLLLGPCSLRVRLRLRAGLARGGLRGEVGVVASARSGGVKQKVHVRELPVWSRHRPRVRSAGAAETWYVDMERPVKLGSCG
jgi:hypothetical protein